MGASNSGTRDRVAWKLVREQYGVIARDQLLALGFTPKAIRHRVERGRLHPIVRGVYAVGRPELSPEGRWMVAVLACGEGAVLSHRSAGALYGICEERDAIEVSVRVRREPAHTGLRVRVRPSLRDRDVGRRRRVPVTSPAQTLVDLASIQGPKTLERAVNEADKLDVIDPETLQGELTRFAGVPGVKPLRTLLDRDTFLLTDDELERRFLALALAAGLPVPITRTKVNGFTVDFYWPELKLVVETDGLRYHRTPAAQARDALRDQTHTAAGFTRLRFSHRQVAHEQEWVKGVLRDTIAQLARS